MGLALLHLLQFGSPLAQADSKGATGDASAQAARASRFYLLFGDEYNLSAPRSGALGGAQGGDAPAPAIFRI